VIAFTGATIYTTPFENPIAGGTVVVDGGVITAVDSVHQAPEGSAHVIDCRGLTITAGFWNCHVHFFERKWANAIAMPADELSEQLADFTRFGFTNAFDLGSAYANTRAIRDRIARGEVQGPRIFSTGEILTPPGIVPPDAVLRVLGVMPVAPHEVQDETQAIRAADALIEQGADALKVFVSGNAPTQKISTQALLAAVRRAHELGKPVFAHTNDTDDVQAALEAGVDVIGHTTPRSGAWPAAIARKARQNGAALTPTLSVWPHLMRHDRISVVRQLERTAVEQLHTWREAGASVLFGTDMGAAQADPAREYELMREAGMDFRNILASLTIEPAQRFRPGFRCGKIAVGCDADLAIFGDSPADVRYTVREGQIVYERR
jgi:imidazolonepropionase-like amidohydrolase